MGGGSAADLALETGSVGSSRVPNYRASASSSYARVPAGKQFFGTSEAIGNCRGQK